MKSAVWAWLVRACTENAGLKLVSLAAALGLFSIVHGTEDAQRALYVDVVALLPPQNGQRILLTEIPDKIKVTLRGSRSILNAVRRDDLGPLQVDLRDGSGASFAFDASSFDLPAGVRVTQVSPESIELRWANRMVKRVPIVVELAGHVAEGLQIGPNVVAVPAVASIDGPANAVSSLDAVHTEPVDVRSLPAGRYERVARLERPPEHVSYQGEQDVRVEFEITHEVSERTWRRINVATVGSPLRVTLRPMHVDVRLRGAPARLAEIDGDHLVPFVDLASLDAARGPVAVRVQVRGVPAGVELVATEPGEILAAVSGRH